MNLETQLKIALVKFLNDEVLENLRKQMRKDQFDINASSSLMQSLTIEKAVVDISGAVSAEIWGEDYWKFVEFGVDGLEVKHGAPYSFRNEFVSRSFVEEVMDWIPARSVPLPANTSVESLAYAIAKNVKKKGFVPRPFVDTAINEINYDKLENDIINIIEEWLLQ